MGREKQVSQQRRRVRREEQRKARRFRGLRHERRCFHRRRMWRVPVLKKAALLTGAAIASAGSTPGQAQAASGGGEPPHSTGRRPPSPDEAASARTDGYAEDWRGESYCHPRGRVLHLRFRTLKAPMVPGNRAGFERLNPRFGVKGRGERRAQPRTVRVQTGLFLKQIEAGARFST